MSPSYSAARVEFKRGCKRRTPVSIITRWTSRCGTVAVERSEILGDLPDRYRAIRLLEDREDLISRHRTRAAAERAARQAAR